MGLLLSIPASASSAVVPISAIRFGLLITEHGPNVADAVVLVEGGKIKGVGHGDAAVPKGAKVIDLRPLGAVKLSGDRGESLVERNAHRTRIDGFAYPTFSKLRGPTPKNVDNWVNLTAPSIL